MKVMRIDKKIKERLKKKRLRQEKRTRMQEWRWNVIKVGKNFQYDLRKENDISRKNSNQIKSNQIKMKLSGHTNVIKSEYKLQLEDVYKWSVSP